MPTHFTAFDFVKWVQKHDPCLQKNSIDLVGKFLKERHCTLLLYLSMHYAQTLRDFLEIDFLLSIIDKIAEGLPWEVLVENNKQFQGGNK